VPAVVRLSDRCTGHGCFPPRPNSQGSPDTFVNGMAVHRQGDSWAVHCCKKCHVGSQSNGSPNTFVNGKAVARVGDSVSCGSSNASGSSNTYVN
jgi:uncharacterized Zn-binding protein involved in type VI secretion